MIYSNLTTSDISFLESETNMRNTSCFDLICTYKKYFFSDKMHMKKSVHICNMNIKFMPCWKAVLSKNQAYHRKHVHKGENIMFRIYNYSKQQKLHFEGLSKMASDSFNKASHFSVSTVGNCNNCNEPDNIEILLGDGETNTISEEFVSGLRDTVLDSPSSPLLPKNSESHPEANPDVGSSD